MEVGGVQVAKLLQYAPNRRLNALQAMAHPFFNELRDPATVLHNGEPQHAMAPKRGQFIKCNFCNCRGSA